MLAVIRHQDERTLSQCRQAVEAQFGEARIVRASPLFKAVRECFDVAIADGADWLITVDADLIIADDYREKLVQHLDKSWTILGDMDCYIAGKVRQGGVRAWRVDALHDKTVHNVSRPESYLCHAHTFHYVQGWVTSRHGYDQSPEYYYRVGANPKWRNRAEWHRRWKYTTDPALRAAYRGFKGWPL